ncbi:hypothetical protein IW262DRAFT_1401100 [Armillaria fumosa]|nr:hypothetical protein IW262DRAFT_1401100 [Armillaria fumosa]
MVAPSVCLRTVIFLLNRRQLSPTSGVSPSVRPLLPWRSMGHLLSPGQQTGVLTVLVSSSTSAERVFSTRSH